MKWLSQCRVVFVRMCGHALVGVVVVLPILQIVVLVSFVKIGSVSGRIVCVVVGCDIRVLV